MVSLFQNNSNLHLCLNASGFRLDYMQPLKSRLVACYILYL